MSTSVRKSLKGIQKIRGEGARDKADRAYDTAHGVKQGSARDRKLDKEDRVEQGYPKKGKS